MKLQLSHRQIFSFHWWQQILGFILIICMTGMLFTMIGKFRYLKGKPKYETPSNGNLEVYDLSAKVDEDIECKKLPTSPPISVCLHNSSTDIVSASIETGQVWELEFIHMLQDLLRGDEELGLLDLGANIGLYSLVAAAMNRPVLSVEPVEGNRKRLAKAVQVNGYQDFITVLPYAISDINAKLSMSLRPDNQGGHRLVKDKEHDVWKEQKKVDVETILMNDLEPYVPFKKAIMKMDIEGQEHRAFVHSKALMDKVEFPYIFMEWLILRPYIKYDGTEDYALVVQLIDLLTGYGYTPFDIHTFQKDKIKLDTADWGQWRKDIIWSKEDK